MTPFLYRCPTTGMMVQSLHDEGDLEDGDAETFLPVECLACSRTHLVNPETGKVMGADDE